MSVINQIIDSVVTENKKPDGLQEGQLWATHSGILKLGEIELRVHVLSDGKRIIDAEDVKAYFDNPITE